MTEKEQELAVVNEVELERQIASALREAQNEAAKVASASFNEAFRSRELKSATQYKGEEVGSEQVNFRPALQMERAHNTFKSPKPYFPQQIPRLFSEEEETFLFRTDGSGSSSIHHPWKVTYGGLTEDEVPLNKWDFIGDTVYVASQGADIPVADGTVTGDAGYVLLHTTRDSDTRELIDAEVIWLDAVPSSDYYSQYRVLAQVDPEAEHKVFQKQFEEIRIFEELVVINGAFALQGYEVSHRNNYEPPI